MYINFLKTRYNSPLFCIKKTAGHENMVRRFNL